VFKNELPVGRFVASFYVLLPLWQLSFESQNKHPVRRFVASVYLLWPVWQHSRRFQQSFFSPIKSCPFSSVAGCLAVSLPAVLHVYWHSCQLSCVVEYRCLYGMYVLCSEYCVALSEDAATLLCCAMTVSQFISDLHGA
jgi:hypothetical protein